MFTPSYRPKAERLLASLRGLALPHVMLEVPTVHRSISNKGSDDLVYSKPRVIAWAIEQYRLPVLYIDADCVLRERPDYVMSLRQHAIDFAAYNWLADLMNDTWVPHEKLAAETGQPLRYWRFSHSIDDFSVIQLRCSGAVQYWGDGPRALALLDEWLAALGRFARTSDDDCLSHAFNFSARGSDFKYAWLTKEYLRYAFWIYVRPVIDHPDLPSVANSHFEDFGPKIANPTQITRSAGKARPFPRSAVIDAVDKLILMPHPPDGRFTPVAQVSMPLFV